MELRQVATITAGHPFRGRIPEQPGSPVVAVQMRDVRPGHGIAWAECIQTLVTGKRESHYLQPSDILVAARGSHNYAIQVGEPLGAKGKMAVAAPHFFVVRLKKEALLPEFMAWLLNQAPIQRHFEQNAEGTLTKSIRRSVLEEAPVSVPPLARQQAIIALANTLREEQRLIQKLAHNGERVMSALARDLYARDAKSVS